MWLWTLYLRSYWEKHYSLCRVITVKLLNYIYVAYNAVGFQKASPHPLVLVIIPLAILTLLSLHLNLLLHYSLFSSTLDILTTLTSCDAVSYNNSQCGKIHPR